MESLENSISLEATCSGFWLEGNILVSCAHVIPKEFDTVGKLSQLEVVATVDFHASSPNGL